MNALREQDILDIQFTIFTRAQKKAIEVAKWIEGEKIHNDPGENYVKHWVKTFAKDFKSCWEKSKCKQCVFEECRYKAIQYCDCFSPNPDLVRLSNENIRPDSH